MTATPTAANALLAAFLEAGWQVVGGRQGLYKRVAVVAGNGAKTHTMTIPLDPSYDDYQDLMDGVMAYLNRLYADGERAWKVLAEIEPDLIR